MNYPLEPVRLCVRYLALCTVMATLTACASRGDLAEVSSLFAECSDATMQFATLADNPAKYHQTARQALTCIDGLPYDTVGMDKTPVMQLHGVAIVNLLKSGELVQAKDELSRFKKAYPRADLMFSDGSSLVDSLDLLLGEVPIERAEKDSLVNANHELKAELRRYQYWNAH